MTHATSTSARVARTMRNPLRMTSPVIMRRLGFQIPVTVPLGCGGTFHGVLPEAVTTNAWRTGYHDRSTTEALQRILSPGDTFVDVGAHFGYFSALCGNIVGAAGLVIAVEAMPETYAYLLRNLHDLPCETKTHQVAAWNRAEDTSFTDGGIINSSLNTAFVRRQKQVSAAAETPVPVRAETLDAILANSPAPRGAMVVKIDAESSELLVLQGMTGCLATHRPAILIELGDGDVQPNETCPSREIIDFLTGFGYEAHVFENEQFVPFTATGPVSYANVLFRTP